MNPKDYIRASDGNGEAVRAVIVEDRDVGQTLINVDSVFNWPHKGIATSGDVDADGIMIEETISVFYFTLYGTMISIDEFAPGYYDQGNTTEQLVVIKPTTPWADVIAEAAEQPSLPAGGTAGQLLTKVSSADGDAEWEDAPEAAGNSIVPKEVPTGAVNGSNTTFTTSQPYTAATLQVYINGLAQSFEATETNPATGQFTITPAPLTGDDLVVSYMFGAVGTMAADTLDGYHANATPTPNTIPVLDSDGALPPGVTVRKQILQVGSTASSITYASSWTPYAFPLNKVMYSSSANTALTLVSGGVRIGAGVSVVRVAATFNYYDTLNADRSVIVTRNGSAADTVGYTRNSPPSGASYTSMSNASIFIDVVEGDIIGMTTTSGAPGTANFFGHSHICVEVLE